jgi:salicylate hydroxylase
VLHQHDGPGQQARDAGLQQAMELTLKAARGEEIPRDAYDGNLNPWLDKAKKDAVLKYDADEAVEEWWNKHGASIIGGNEG